MSLMFLMPRSWHNTTLPDENIMNCKNILHKNGRHYEHDVMQIISIGWYVESYNRIAIQNFTTTTINCIAKINSATFCKLILSSMTKYKNTMRIC